jgi:hypothetical protein
VLVPSSPRRRRRWRNRLSAGRASLRRFLQHLLAAESLKDGLKVSRRSADHFEHIRGGSLLLQGFARLVQQTPILDGDHGLISERLQQGDLALSEESRLRAT